MVKLIHEVMLKATQKRGYSGAQSEAGDAIPSILNGKVASQLAKENRFSIACSSKP